MQPLQKLAATQMTASLVTCYPGPEIFELYGHEAIRIQGVDSNGEPFDSVWNYGVFDFNTNDFVYRFVKGETDYMVAGYPFAWFLADYHHRGSKVVEQPLNFTPEQTLRLRKMLQKESLPQNCTYRYNYLLDNCATRVADRVSEAVGDSIVTVASPRFSTFREGMRYYNRNYPWYQFGIDLVLGPGLDDDSYGIRQERYLPLELRKLMTQSRFIDGRPVVNGERVLLEGRGDMTLPPTPFWMTPMAAMILLLVLCALFCIISWRRKRIVKWWWAFFYTLLGIPGCVIFFLCFFSSHSATFPNQMIYWLNPLQLIVPFFIWSRMTRPCVTALMWLNILAVGILLLAWAFQPQSTNPAIFPLMIADLLMALVYAILNYRNSYNNTAESVASSRSVRTPKRKPKSKTSSRKK